MYIGITDTQNTSLNISAINRSAGNKNEALNGKKKEEQTDVAAISPAGKKQSMLEQLMKQKEFLQERKQSLLDSAAENGSEGISEQLEEYDKQLDQLDQQITQLQTEQTDETDSKDDNTGKIYEKPKTKEEVQTDQLNAITELSANSEQAEVQSSVQNRLDGRVNVLKAYIKSANGAIESRVEEAADLENRSQQLSSQIAEKLQEINDSIPDTENIIKEIAAAKEEDTKEDTVTDDPESESLSTISSEEEDA